MIQQMIYKGTAKGYQTVAKSDGLGNLALLRRLELLCRTPGVSWVRQGNPCPIFSRCALEDGIAVGLSVKDARDDRNRSLSHVLYVPRQDVPDFSAYMAAPEMFRTEYPEDGGDGLPEIEIESGLQTPKLDAIPGAAQALFGGSAELLASFLAAVQRCCEAPEQRDFYGICVCLPEIEERRSADAYRLMEVILRVYRRPGILSVGYRTLWNGPENNTLYPIFFTSPQYMANVGELTGIRYILLDVAEGGVRLPRRTELSPTAADAALAEALMNGSEQQIADAIRGARIYERERLARERQEKERLERERLEKERLEQERQERERQEKERLERERQERERQEKERLERESQEKERQEQERLEKERLERERLVEARNLEAERRKQERLAEERRAEEARRAEQARLLEERQRRAEQERRERERAAEEQRRQELARAEELARAQAAQKNWERIEAEARQEAQRRREQAERDERQARERAEASPRTDATPSGAASRAEEPRAAGIRSADAEIANARQIAEQRRRQQGSIAGAGRRGEASRSIAELRAIQTYDVAWGRIERAVAGGRGAEVASQLYRDLIEQEKSDGPFEQLRAAGSILDKLTYAVIHLPRRDYDLEEDYLTIAMRISGAIRENLFFLKPNLVGRSGAGPEQVKRLSSVCIERILLLCGCCGFPIAINPHMDEKLQFYNDRDRVALSAGTLRWAALWRILYSVYYGFACDLRDLGECRRTLQAISRKYGSKPLGALRSELARQAIEHMRTGMERDEARRRSAVTACYYACYAPGAELELPRELDGFFAQNPKIAREVVRELKRIQGFVRPRGRE